MVWARQISVLFFLVWLLALVLPGVATTVVLWALSRRSMPGTTIRLLVGMATGILSFYVEAFVFAALRPDILLDPMAAANLVPGVVTGVFVTYFVVGLNSARTRNN
jgi:hypothetical protein